MTPDRIELNAADVPVDTIAYEGFLPGDDETNALDVGPTLVQPDPTAGEYFYTLSKPVATNDNYEFTCVGDSVIVYDYGTLRYDANGLEGLVTMPTDPNHYNVGDAADVNNDSLDYGVWQQNRRNTR